MPETKWKEGDKVYIIGDLGYCAPGTIYSFTATGRINVQYKDGKITQFDTQGVRREGDGWGRKTYQIDNVSFPVRRAWVIQQKECRVAQDAIIAIGKGITIRESNFRLADRLELKQQISILEPLLAVAKSLVEAIGDPVVLNGKEGAL